ncbi:MAG: hypothetical protein AAGJ70_04745 [Pseudomonadota bacterium]
MSRFAACAALAAAILVTPFTSTTATAESVRVSISYNLTIKADSDGADDIAAAQSKGRRAMYQMMAAECDVLNETIAASCKLSNFNIQSGNRYRRRANNNADNNVQIRGTGSYRIEMK